MDFVIIFILGDASFKYKYKNIKQVYGITEMMPSCFVYILPISVYTALYFVLLICKQWLKGKEAVVISVFPFPSLPSFAA